MAGRNHIAEVVRVTANCDRCTFNVTSKNAQALAAQHHDRTNHRTHVETTMRITYGASLGETNRSVKQKGLFP